MEGRGKKDKTARNQVIRRLVQRGKRVSFFKGKKKNGGGRKGIGRLDNGEFLRLKKHNA